MNYFKMNSLIGSDTEGNDVISSNENWVELDAKIYLDYFKEVQGDNLVLETKGQDTQKDQTKRAFLDEWVRAVNMNGGFGKWTWAVSKNPMDVKGIIAKLGQ